MISLIHQLITDFFKSNKSVDYFISPPTKTLETKIDFVLEEILSVFKNVLLNQEDRDRFFKEIKLIKKEFPVYQSSIHSYLKKESRGACIVEIIASEMTLREIFVVMEEFKIQFDFFKDTISWVDLLGHSYIKIHYPELRLFFELTEKFLKDGFQVYRKVDSYNPNQQKDDEKDFDDFILTYLPELVSSDLTIYKKLISLVSHCYTDRFISNYTSNDGLYLREKSTSDSGNLKKYLCEVLKIEDSDTDLFDLYRDLSKNIKLINKVESSKIYKLSRFIRNTNSLNVNGSFFINLAEEILRRFENGKFPFAGYDYGADNLKLRLVYEFSYLILWSIETANKDSKIIYKSKSCLLRFLKLNIISYTSKFIIIDAFVNHEKEGKGDIGFRFEKAWKEFLNGNNDKTLIRAIKDVFFTLNSDYFISQEKSLYKNEEHYTYIMYQNWSGKIDNNEINSIRSLAMRELDKNLDVVEKYWNYYPSVEELKSGDMFVAVKYSEFNTGNLYMPIENLINVSLKINGLNKDIKKKLNGWNKNLKIISQDDKYKYLFELKEKKDTLRGYLIRNGIL